MLLQRGADCPNWLLYQLVRDAYDRPNGYISILKSDPSTKVLIHATTVMDLYDYWRQHQNPIFGQLSQLRELQMDFTCGVAFPRLLRDSLNSNGVSDQTDAAAQLARRRGAFVSYLQMSVPRCKGGNPIALKECSVQVRLARLFAVLSNYTHCRHTSDRRRRSMAP